MLQVRFLISALAVMCLAGCRSRMVDVTIVNQGPALHVMEFDYPNASFGVNQLGSGAQYQYKIKVQGEGPVSLAYEDAAGHKKTATGPKMTLGDQGSLLVSVDPAGAVHWSASLTPK